MLKQAKHLSKSILTLGIVIGATLILAVLILLKPQLSKQPVEAADASPPSTEAQEETIETPEIPDYPTAQTVNGIQIRWMGVQQEEKTLAVNVCFDLPDDSDWTIWDSILTVGEKTYHWTEMAPTKIRKPPVDGMQEVWTFLPEGGVQIESVVSEPNPTSYRCETVYFRGATNLPPDVPLMLTIEALVAVPREGESCSSAYLRKVQDALDARQTGITVKCNEEEYIDGLEVVTKPEAMSQEAAQAYLSNPDFYLDLNGRRGPWVFTLTLD